MHVYNRNTRSVLYSIDTEPDTWFAKCFPLCFSNFQWKLPSFHQNELSIPVNLFPHTDAFWCLCSKCLLKTLWQKEKLLIMSNFFFCNDVFNSISTLIFHLYWFFLILGGCFQCRLTVWGKELNPNVKFLLNGVKIRTEQNRTEVYSYYLNTYGSSSKTTMQENKL